MELPFEDHDILELRAFMEQNFLHFQAQSLTRPQGVDFREPAVLNLVHDCQQNSAIPHKSTRDNFQTMKSELDDKS